MQLILTSSSSLPWSLFPCRTLSSPVKFGTFCFQKKQMRIFCSSNHNLKDETICIGKERIRKEDPNYEENLKRRGLLFFFISSVLFPSSFFASAKTKNKNPYDEKRLLEQNRRVQEANNAPEDFPKFVREGFQVKVVTSDNYVKCDSGLIYLDIEVGKGDCPKAGQQVTFHYVGYNESGRRIDSTYLQGSPARIRVGTNALVPGFEEGIKDMRPGGKRRVIIPPELGPPVGPSTFFSAKQFEVFDVELLSVQNCERRTIAFYSDLVCN